MIKLKDAPLRPGTGGAQDLFESLPELPELIPVANMTERLSYPENQRTGFKHRNGEFNFLLRHEGRMYRLPESKAIQRARYENLKYNIKRGTK
mgnify:FL=1